MSAAPAVKFLNPHAEVSRRGLALHASINAAGGLEDILRSNLGPRGTLKLLVSGSGELKLTKDGAVLLHNMEIIHPTAKIIARAATAQDDECGDGTTSVVLLVGEILRQAERPLVDGIHPRHLVDGIELARTELLRSFIPRVQIAVDRNDREQLGRAVRCALATKLSDDALVAHISDLVADAALIVHHDNEPIDLFMVEIMTIESRTAMHSSLVRGLVLDHGTRHPDMPKDLENAYVLTCNVSLEYEKPELGGGFFYSSAGQRERLAQAEREAVAHQVEKILRLKRQVCDEVGTKAGFLIVNQKGISPDALEMLAREGIMALRRAKRRNMERLVLACGGTAVNSLDDLNPSVLGKAVRVFEETHGEDKYTFVEAPPTARSCTLVLRGSDKQTLQQLKDAVRDGLHTARHFLDDAYVVPGGGAFECAAYQHLQAYSKTVQGRARLGVQTFADALLVIPKTLAENSGLDAQETVLQMIEAHEAGRTVGLDAHSGELVEPLGRGIVDCCRPKRHALSLASTITTQLLLVDELLKAGRDTRSK
ncbi:chaperonin containing TCP1, subunit 6a [Cyanidioschyzon merolae strain 10D]|uniref:Chaperonin containing TCP1, subunit 6a n=1 Tax=Cyanidioschyzon merolae (strain NIES-3377 / 10D) TaxID=280699 RepID=M1V4N4_CYAM1|nr:chaperonin containing TCP1, subunit 6a [Cyanidioschyzon merolae strain 10D]BAM79540.1 chaperonin containing TCP1, subunit 6a [Cyanidioschyzon merolae strain 10D]|eukprot:XP_005535826.1 chaperonin containing TCP1, subunit 6a [Cyanidioschyzon merolae strain 10D]